MVHGVKLRWPDNGERRARNETNLLTKQLEFRNRICDFGIVVLIYVFAALEHISKSMTDLLI